MTIVEEAEQIINGERREAYGKALESFQRVAKLWSEILGITVTPSQVCIMMAAFKSAREANSHKRDNLVDIVGYLLLEKKIEEEGNLPF